MALQKQTFKLTLAQGMDQRADPKTLTSALTLIENGVYRKEGEVGKRPGWQSLSQSLSTGGSISSADALATFENELLLWSNQRLYTWSSSQSKWYDRGAVYSAAVENKQIISSTASYDVVDSVYSSGLVLIAYEIGQKISYQTYDYASGAILKGDTQLAGATSRFPHCVALTGSTSVFIFYKPNTSPNILGAIISPITGAVTSTVTITTGAGTGGDFDVLAVASDTIMLSFRDSLGQVAIKYLNSSLTARGGSYVDSASQDANSGVFRLVPLSSSRVLVVRLTADTNIQASVVSATGTVGAKIDTGIPYQPVAFEYVNNIAGHANGTDAILYAHVGAASPKNDYIWKASVPTGGGAGTAALFLRSVGLASRAFLYNSIGFVTLVNNSVLQSTFFVIDQNGVVVSRHQPTAAGISVNLVGFSCLSSVWSASSGRFEFGILNKTRIIPYTDTAQLFNFSGSATPLGSNLFSPLNVAMTSLDFQDENNFTTAELGGTLLIAGGVINMYDGLSVVEHSFFLFPEDPFAVLATAGAGVANGTYLYCAMYEWTDAKGKIHRSAPSIPLKVTVTGGPRRVDVTVPTLRITQKKTSNSRASVSIVLYRTQDAQSSPFFRISSLTSPNLNDPTVDTVTIGDSVPDAQLPGREYLYTAGGVLDNAAGLPASYIKVWRGRVMLGGLEGSQIQYSKPCGPDSPVEFSAENTIDLEADGGRMTGFEILDEKLIVYKKDWPYLTYGDGPDALGSGSAFAPLERIASCDVGCIDQQSTCAIPGAAIFKSTKGYQLLGRDLSTAYIGDMVEDYNPLTVTSANLFAAQSEIRITNSDGSALVYNYEFKRWSVFTDYDAVDALRWNGGFVHAKADGRVCVEAATPWRDNSANYDVTFITGWQALGDLSGFQRIYRAEIVGEYRTPHALSLYAAYDYNDTWIDLGTLNLAAGASDNNRWQYFMDRQKCTAIRFRIKAVVSEGVTSGEAIKLSAMTLLFGMKKPLSKLSGSNKTGLAII